MKLALQEYSANESLGFNLQAVVSVCKLLAYLCACFLATLIQTGDAALVFLLSLTLPRDCVMLGCVICLMGYKGLSLYKTLCRW